MTRMASMQAALATAALLLVVLLATTDATAADTQPGPWWTGRATFYGGPSALARGGAAGSACLCCQPGHAR